MTTYQILYWGDIPSQVRARAGRERVSSALSERFQQAIDAAAMACGMAGSDDYTNQFAWGEAIEREGNPAEVAAAVCIEIEADTVEIDWQATAAAIRARFTPPPPPPARL